MISISPTQKPIGVTRLPHRNYFKEEFIELYAPFGYSDALKRDEASLSYLAG
jgi:hypothetical protein